MTDEFLMLEYPADNSEGHCIVDQLTGFEDEWVVSQGRSLAAAPPAKLTIAMSPDEPRKTVLPDYVQNMNRLLIVSPRLRAFFEAQGVGNVEYYPIEIKDHKGKVASDQYAVAHLTNPVECIDVESSGVKWMGQGLETQRIFRMRSLTIDPAKVPQDRTLFFARYYNKAPLLRRELAEAMMKENFTNVDIVPIAKHAV